MQTRNKVKTMSLTSIIVVICSGMAVMNAAHGNWGTAAGNLIGAALAVVIIKAWQKRS
jgi:hypothetical protein